MSFESILNNIKEQKELTQLVIEPGDPTSRTKAGMINQAKIQLEQLRQDFRDEALRKAVFIVVYGKKSREVSKLMTEEFDVKAGSPRILAKKVVDRIPDPSLYDNRMLHPSVIDACSSILDDLAKDMGITYLPTFYYDGLKHAVHLTCKADLEKVVEATILNGVGGEIFAISAIMDTIDSLIEEGYTSPVLPIVLETTEEDSVKLTEDLLKLNSNVFRVSTSGEAADLKLPSKTKVDSAAIQKVLVEIKQNIKQ